MRRLSSLQDSEAHLISDLKPENVVISRLTSPSSSNILVKIIDFGVGKSSLYMMESSTVSDSLTASQSNEDRVRMITNPYWRSPESWVGMTWGPASDIWSFGAIVRASPWFFSSFGERLCLLLRLARSSWSPARNCSSLWVDVHINPLQPKTESS